MARRKITKTCALCQREFQNNIPKQRYCSPQCFGHTRIVPLAERFRRHVETAVGDGCWIWRGSVAPHGYGTMDIDGHTRSAHRVSYELAHGPITNGLWVLHNCDNKLCVNPSHLRLGTPKENMADRSARQRWIAPVGSAVRSAKLTEADIVAIRSDRRQLKDISAEYGVSESTINNIRNRVRWRHVA